MKWTHGDKELDELLEHANSIHLHIDLFSTFVFIQYDFCRKCAKRKNPMENLAIPENTTLVTMDVTSLYTNIPHDDGIAACRKIWEQRTDQEPPTDV